MGGGVLGGPEDRIFGIVRQVLPASASAAQLRPDQSLQDAGLKSLDLVNLMLAIEAEFDLEIPEDHMTPERFESVAAIRDLVANLSASD
jgi:acyl carrier protein